MAKAPPAKTRARGSAIGADELFTLLDFVRYAVTQFIDAKIVFAHGTTDPVAEAVFLVCEPLHLRPEQFDAFAHARLTSAERKRALDLIDRRIRSRTPAAYLLNKIYMRGVPFYVDERVIVPRSFIGELLETRFTGDATLIEDPDAVTRGLDLCTGSGCLAVLAARAFPRAHIDAVDVSKDALAVADRNIAEHGLSERIALHRGDLFAPLGDERYDIVISNPPYVDADGMAALPEECLREPRLAFDGGADGLAIVRRILDGAKRHLTAKGGLLCEVGRGRANVEAAYPDLSMLWLDTEESEGEVFWIAAEDL